MPIKASILDNFISGCYEVFSPSEDGQEGPLRFLQSHGKVVQLLLHQEAGRLLRKVHSHHGAVRGGRGAGDINIIIITDVTPPLIGTLLTCGLCELSRRRRSRKRLPVWTETP